jgi:tetratricopeptide (TPR) repeat protein
MNAAYFAVVFFILSLSSAAFGQQSKLEGMVTDDKGNAVVGVRIIAPGGQARETDAKGHFAIPFPASVQPGQATRIEVVKPGWVIYEPMMGACVTQSAARNFEPLKVIIVAKGTLLALSPERISRVVAQWTGERVRLRAQVAEQKDQLAEQEDQLAEQKNQLDEYAFLREYAEKYGFTLEEFKNAADRWAKIIESDDKEERARKEYWLKNYERAAQLAGESGDDAVNELERANRHRFEAGRKAIRRYQLEGDSFYQKDEFRDAIAAYNKIENLFSARKIAKDDFLEEWAQNKMSLGNTKRILGTRVEWQEGKSLFGEAEMVYGEALTVFTRERSPKKWAWAQSDLGNALMSHGEKSSGEESMRLLGEAIAAHREALKVYTYESFPESWAGQQYNLGLGLMLQGDRSSGGEAMRLRAKAIAAYREALKVFTHEQSKWYRAFTQHYLGKVLRLQGELSNGQEGMRLLGEAVTACHEALKVFTPKHRGLVWAKTQYNLGSALMSQSKRSSGEESMRLLAGSVAAYNEAIKEYTLYLPLGEKLSAAEEDQLRLLAETITACREALKAFGPEQSPQQWAETQYNLGRALVEQIRWSSEETSMKLRAEAITAYREALKVYTIDQLPKEWVKTQSNLGHELSSQGAQSSEEEGMRLLGEAVTAYREALKGSMPDQAPKDWQDWASFQKNLGATLALQGKRSRGEEGIRLLGEAATAYREALKGFTREQSLLALGDSVDGRALRPREKGRRTFSPHDWARTQNDLGVILALQGERLSGEDGMRLLDEAVTAYREALNVFKPDSQLSRNWAETHSNLSNALRAQSKRSSGADVMRLLAESVAAHNEALKEYTSLLNTIAHFGEIKPHTVYPLPGEEGMRLLAEAITACREDLKAFTPEQLPRQWAATHYNLGNALRAQSKRSSGGGLSLLAEAITTLREALKIYTREQFPQEWAKTQEEIGRTLMAQSEQSDGAESVRLLGEAVTAYRQSLKVYTLEKFPKDWSDTQYILGYMLRSQGERSSGEDSIRLLGEAVTAYREALKGYTSEKFSEKREWAATQLFMGVVLVLQSERSGGAEGERMLGEAITAYREALEGFSRENWSRGSGWSGGSMWAETQDNLGRAYMLLKKWNDAAVCFENALTKPSYKGYIGSYQSLASIYHERLFEYEKAFDLHQEILSRFPQDTNALAGLAEAHFTTGRYFESSRKIKPLLTNPELSDSSKIALQMIEVANLLALENADKVPAALAALHQTVSFQKADFRIDRSFSGALNFINRQERFDSHRAWLNQFFGLAQAENCDAIVKALREAQAQFRP